MGAKIVSNNGKKTLPGVHVPHHKNTNDCVPQVMPVPDKVYISLHMHMGAPCDPLVKKGDTVEKGQILVSGAVPVVGDDGETTGYQYQKADADIRARTILEYEDTENVQYPEKIYFSKQNHISRLEICILTAENRIKYQIRRKFTPWKRTFLLENIFRFLYGLGVVLAGITI